MTEILKQIRSALTRFDSGHIDRLRIALDLYPEGSLIAAAQAFAPHCTIKVEPAAQAGEVLLSVAPLASERGRQAAGEFLNFLLLHALRTHLGLAEDEP